MGESHHHDDDVKSVAGTLGAQAICEAAQALELACSNGSRSAVVEAQLLAVTHELSPVIDGLSSLVNSQEDKLREPAEPDTGHRSR